MIDEALKKYLADAYAAEEAAVQKARQELEAARQGSSSARIDDKEKALSKAKKKLERCATWKSWLVYTAGLAPQLKVTTHPCTFSHPSADRQVDVTPILADCVRANDGLLRSGNFNVTGGTDVDVYGNAAALPAFSFLQVHLQCDGRTLLQHLMENSEQARELLKEAGEEAGAIRQNFLQALGDPGKQQESSSRVKQVYFPVGNGRYHLLSILTPAVGIHEMKERIEARRKDQDDGSCPRWIPNPITVGFGGSKPQNISYLNNKSHGTYALLPSLPPELETRTIRLPRHDFFKETLYYRSFEDIFRRYAKLFSAGYTNMRIRASLDGLFNRYIDRIILLMGMVRKEAAGVPLHDFSGLPERQRIWLDPDREEERRRSSAWVEGIEEDIARSFLRGFRILKIKDAPFEEDVLFHELKKQLDQQKEALS